MGKQARNKILTFPKIAFEGYPCSCTCCIKTTNATNWFFLLFWMEVTTYRGEQIYFIILNGNYNFMRRANLFYQKNWASSLANFCMTGIGAKIISDCFENMNIVFSLLFARRLGREGSFWMTIFCNEHKAFMIFSVFALVLRFGFVTTAL